jgi:alpha-beta hydrolase superfamily lysophospholipase
MALFSEDPLHEGFADWAFGFSPFGGGDAGELQILAGQVKPGDDGSFFEAFRAMAVRRIDQGDRALAAGHRATARDFHLHAAVYLGVGNHVLYGKPVDPRLVDTSHLQAATFDKVAALGEPPGEKVDIPYQGTKLPAYFFRAPGHEKDVRPVILVGGGWDSTLTDNYLGVGIAALRRGYHILLHDGPGQGKLLIDEGLPLRHDWEKVVTPVVDAALRIDVVDPRKIVYQPWSLGGYMAPRVAAFEHRLAATIADPGQIDVGGKFLPPLKALGLGAEAIARLPALDPGDEQMLMGKILSDRRTRWTIVQRGFWTNGASDLSSFLAEIFRWKLDPDLVAQIRCPTLVTSADGDSASSNAQQLYDALKCPKRRIHFSTADGAGMHCALLNRTMACNLMLDWLDDVLRDGRRS